MQRHPVRKPFNLVEITLAMGVIGMGIAGVMALMQLGMKSNKNAIGDNYAADAADQFVTYFYGAAANAAMWSIGTNQGLKDPATSIYLSPNNPDGDGSLEGSTTWTDIPNSNLQSSTVSGLYRVNQGSTAGVADFEAAVRVWQTQITGVYFSDSHASESIDEDYGIGLNIEVSWPVGKPYDRREKRHYYVEIFNRNK